MPEEQKIVALLKTHNKERVYQMDDGSVVTYSGGSASWRHNNPGNLKFEYANSADHTVHTSRTKEKALSDAQHRYNGIVALDQWGNAIFETYEAGRAAKVQLLTHQHGDRTVPEMLRKYSKPDYTGATHWEAQEASIYKTADAQGVNLRGKKIGDMNASELSALADGIKNFEGWKKGTIEINQQPEKTKAPEVQPSTHIGNYHRANSDDQHKGLSPAHQLLIADASKQVHELYQQHGLPIDQGTQNTVMSVAAAAAEKGLTRIEMASVQNNQIQVFQDRGAATLVAAINGNVAANTPEDQSLQKLAQLEQHKTQTMNNPVQAEAAPVRNIA